MQDRSLLIVIPARYASTRLPGKPLRDIAGIPMLVRTYANAARCLDPIRERWSQVELCVATDDDRITHFCKTHNLRSVETSRDVKTGSDRALAAVDAIDPDSVVFSHVLNLQGDAPFTPPEHIRAIATALEHDDVDAATAYVQLSWEALDALRQHKIKAPFSGTTLIVDSDGRAVWFSKQIIPAIRGEAALRASGQACPTRRHIGLYGYRRQSLNAFAKAPTSHYERYEGLEQLRLLELGYTMMCAEVAVPRISLGGIDTEADIALAEDLIRQHGDPHGDWAEPDA